MPKNRISQMLNSSGGEHQFEGNPLSRVEKLILESVEGGGILKGKNCKISSITEIEGGHRVSFLWTLDNGTEQTASMNVMDGQDGETPTISVTRITGGHRLTFTTSKGSESFDVMNGTGDGSGGGGTSDYEDLANKPRINGTELIGNLTAEQLGIVPSSIVPVVPTNVSAFVNDAGYITASALPIVPTVPTKVSDLTNDAGFITSAVNNLVNYYLKNQLYSKDEIDALLTAIKNSRFEVVSEFPTEDIKTNVIYLIPKRDPVSGDIKEEYINLDGTSAGWEKIGNTSVPISGYVTSEQLNTALADYVTSMELSALIPSLMPSADMGSVISPLPGVMSRRFKYSTDEQVVGEWIDGKPIYQKTYTGLNIQAPSNSWKLTNIVLPENMNLIVDAQVLNTPAILNFIGVSPNNGKIELLNTRSGAQDVNAITIRYTKTTD